MCSHTDSCFFFFFFNDTATTEIYTLSLHDALPICAAPDTTAFLRVWHPAGGFGAVRRETHRGGRGGRFGALDADCAAGGMAGRKRPRDSAGGAETVHAGERRVG